ncbi:MAG: DUF4249 family protein [Bacteroidales bacterium]|nr:DUF4249 family protein [Bacteroidales bacterium]
MKSYILSAIALMSVSCVTPELYYDTYDKEICGSHYFAEPQLDVYATISNADGLHGTVQITTTPDAKNRNTAPQNIEIFLKSDNETIAKTIAEPVENENYAVFDISTEKLRFDYTKEYVIEVASAEYGTASSEAISLVKPFEVDTLGCLFDYHSGCEFFAKLQNSSADTYYAMNIRTYYNGEIYEGDEFAIRGIDANEVQKAGTIGVTKYAYVDGPWEARTEDNKRVYVDSVRVDLVKYSSALTTFALDLMLAEETYNDGFADAPKQVSSNMIGGIGFCGSYYVISKTFYNDVHYGNKLRDEFDR